MTAGAHRRMNLLTGRWVLVSPHRLQRPWQGAVSRSAGPAQPAHDPACHLCPGNTRASGVRNPDYADVFVFDNDYPALLGGSTPPAGDRLLLMEAETGVCRVICYGPEHHLAMADMPPTRIRRVIDVWAEQFADLIERPDIGAVTMFENRGEMMGASSPHPHGQIWATSGVPDEMATEEARQRAHFASERAPLLLDYLARELDLRERIIVEERHFVVLTPFWATWPFETLVLPRRAAPNLAALDGEERDSLARALADITKRYDALFGVPFPYSMGWHQWPDDAGSHVVVHAHFYPPLLRSATVRKFMVGFEMLAMPQRDLTPEAAAERLRAAR
jgi:UDPglucose--hexose-1-phosphate uridylyltransferase